MIQEISKSPRRKIFRAKTKRTDQRSAYRTGENTRWRRPRKRLDNISGEYPRCHHSAVEDFFQEGYRHKTFNGGLCILQDEKVRNIGKTDTNQSFA